MAASSPCALFIGSLALVAVGCDATDPVPGGGAPADTPALFVNEIMASSASFLDAGGAATDWVEIYNAEAEAVDLAGMRLCDDHYASDGVSACHAIPSGAPADTTVAAGGFIVFDFNGAGGGPREVPLKLGGAGDAVFLLDGSGRVVDEVSYGAGDGLDADDVSFGRAADGGGDWSSFAGGPGGHPTPGAPNGSVDGEPGDPNQPLGPSPPTVGAVSLEPSAPTFADVITVSAQADDVDGDLAAVTLSYALDDGPPTEVAMVRAGAGWGVAIGPFAAGGALRHTVSAVDAGGRETRSPEASVAVAAPSGPRPLINEVMAVNASFPDDAGAFPDWVEIYNAGDQPADLGGMYLADDHYGDGLAAFYAIPADAVPDRLAPGAFVVFWFDKEDQLGPRHVTEKLSGAADAVYLVDADGETIADWLTWDEATGLDRDDVSFGRVPDGGDAWTLFGPAEARPASPGATNGE